MLGTWNMPMPVTMNNLRLSKGKLFKSQGISVACIFREQRCLRSVSGKVACLLREDASIVGLHHWYTLRELMNCMLLRNNLAIVGLQEKI